MAVVDERLFTPDRGLCLASRWPAPRCALLVASAFVLSGCPVDERELVEYIASDGFEGGRSGSKGISEEESAGEGGQAESGNGGKGGSSSNAANAGATVSGGQAGAGGASVGTDACPDLDRNGVPDCVETKVRNASFGEDTSEWSEENGMSLSWSESDARKVSESGSLVVENRQETDRDGQFMTGARQCLDIPEPAVYRAAADILVPAGQGEGSGGIQMLFYDDVGCSGRVVTNGMSSAVPAGDNWKVVSVSRTVLPGIKSVALRLVAVKPFRAKSFKVSFDNVLVRRDY